MHARSGGLSNHVPITRSELASTKSSSCAPPRDRGPWPNPPVTPGTTSGPGQPLASPSSTSGLVPRTADTSACVSAIAARRSAFCAESSADLWSGGQRKTTRVVTAPSGVPSGMGSSTDIAHVDFSVTTLPCARQRRAAAGESSSPTPPP